MSRLPAARSSPRSSPPTPPRCDARSTGRSRRSSSRKRRARSGRRFAVHVGFDSDAAIAKADRRRGCRRREGDVDRLVLPVLARVREQIREDLLDAPAIEETNHGEPWVDVHLEARCERRRAAGSPASSCDRFAGLPPRDARRASPGSSSGDEGDGPEDPTPRGQGHRHRRRQSNSAHALEMLRVGGVLLEKIFVEPAGSQISRRAASRLRSRSCTGRALSEG